MKTIYILLIIVLNLSTINYLNSAVFCNPICRIEIAEKSKDDVIDWRSRNKINKFHDTNSINKKHKKGKSAHSVSTKILKSETLDSYLKYFNKYYDKIKKTYVLKEKTSPKTIKQNAFYVYINENNGENPDLFLTINYAACDWLYIQRYIIYTKHQKFIINKRYFEEIKLNKDNGMKWESFDRKVDKNELKILQTILKSEKVRIRFEGREFSDERNITPVEKRSIQRILNAYQLMGGQL